MTVSVLVPSRERPALLKRSLGSLGDGDLEFLIRVDEDDPAQDGYAGLSHVIVGPRHGYGGLHNYYNELAAQATGDWIMVWNDDCVMTTPGWIDIVRRYDGKMVVLNPNTNHDNWVIDMNVFPIVPRQMFELMGHISLSVHNDSWLEFVGRGADIMIRVPITIHHDRADLTGNNDDAVYSARQYDHEDFHSEGMVQARDRDIGLIREYLEHNEHARLRQPQPDTP